MGRRPRINKNRVLAKARSSFPLFSSSSLFLSFSFSFSFTFHPFCIQICLSIVLCPSKQFIIPNPTCVPFSLSFSLFLPLSTLSLSPYSFVLALDPHILFCRPYPPVFSSFSYRHLQTLLPYLVPPHNCPFYFFWVYYYLSLLISSHQTPLLPLSWLNPSTGKKLTHPERLQP